MSSSSLAVLSRHTSYLAEDLISASIFDETVPVAERTLHARKIHDVAATRELEIQKPTLPAITSSSSITDYIGERSRVLFNLLGVPRGFLAADNWTERPEYSTVKASLRNLSTLNDSAERALSLASTYNTCITQDEPSYQELVQVVEAHRKQYRTEIKATLRHFY